MNFDSAAKEIVANSIRSAICIDDEFVEPYEEARGNVKNVNTPKQLRELFRKSNCSLDVYTYKGYPELETESEFVFKNRDLLILDWKLTDGPIKFKDALDILKDAVENPSLAFVLIYTNEQDLDDIEMQIRSFFNRKTESTKESNRRIYNQLLSCLDEEFFLKENSDSIPESAEAFFKDNKIKGVFKEFFMNGPSDEAVKDFKAVIRDYFGSQPDQQKIGAEFLKRFEETVKKLYGCDNLFKGCEQIEFYNRNTYISPKPFHPDIYCHKLHGQLHALWVNNTYITIFNKIDTPDTVYKNFSSYLCCSPGNIMTLIALEMKNNFRENSGKVGKNLLAVDELAFFHHRRTLSDEEEFYDFLRNNWKHQVASFHLNSDSKVFPVMDEYIDKNRINDTIDKRKNGDKEESFRQELAKLNFQYSFHHTERKERDYLRFGDIFSVQNSAEAIDIDGYLLNITAHCDCLRPDKINYYFHFVSGKIDSLKNALKYINNEDDCFSFFCPKNTPLCISWEIKPFTIFIPEEKRRFSPGFPIEIEIGKESKYLFYEGALLENYAQRIANKAFAHAARVGIDLVGWGNESKKESKK
ncbi:MAG: response regulator receiver domain [Candidatus Aminicenantes bacterium]|nr:response regulator receiver domain [Candidatus Aminicenantes bacterium]